MSTIPQITSQRVEPAELYNGDRMTQEEFHRVYERMPSHFRAELIGGVVHVASPLGLPHGQIDIALGTALFVYAGHTPGVEVSSNTTVLLDRMSELQPDAFIRILPEYGGQSRTTAEGYVSGPPELVAEVAHSSRAIDLGAKREEYARNGVREYVVLSVKERSIYWFDLSRKQQLSIPADGILRAATFPGLWINRDALLARDVVNLLGTINQGLAAPEHARFVSELAAAHRSPK